MSDVGLDHDKAEAALEAARLRRLLTGDFARLPQPSLGEVTELFSRLVSVDIDPESKVDSHQKAQAVVVAGLDYCVRYLRALARDLPA